MKHWRWSFLEYCRRARHYFFCLNILMFIWRTIVHYFCTMDSLHFVGHLIFVQISWYSLWKHIFLFTLIFSARTLVRTAKIFVQIFLFKHVYICLNQFLSSGLFYLLADYGNWSVVFTRYKSPNSWQKMSGILNTMIPTFCNSVPLFIRLTEFFFDSDLTPMSFQLYSFFCWLCLKT